MSKEPQQWHDVRLCWCYEIKQEFENLLNPIGILNITFVYIVDEHADSYDSVSLINSGAMNKYIDKHTFRLTLGYVNGTLHSTSIGKRKDFYCTVTLYRLHKHDEKRK